MRINYRNINGLYLNQRGGLSRVEGKRMRTYVEKSACIECGEPFLTRNDKNDAYCSKGCVAVSPIFSRKVAEATGNPWTPEYKKGYYLMKSREYQLRKKNLSPQLTKEEQHRVELLYRWAQELPGSWHVDHIIPLSGGGVHHPDNLQLIPALQNQQKINKHPKEFYGRHYDFLVKGVIQYEN